ncbi:glutathione S-transferase T3-like [Eutrema salsugineum]|uniref:glutathione S-transferase T3-like n=1 Tax=Eutrema salsugineum TaxID=72664 RepID=UPI000CED26BE|nr:glutathione S-transferase T3-like [Eutrema salsugineum]
MDPYPLSQPSNFVDLLTSQHEPSLNDGFLSVDHVPVFGTQLSQATNYAETTAQRVDRRTWVPNEDVLLINVWLNTSKDPVVGNEQKSRTFWKRIAIYYAEFREPSMGAPREAGQCKQRWHKINDLVCKLCGSYEAATRDKTSGMNENDVIKMAHQIYFNDQKKKFNLEHAWKELRNDQKWAELLTTKTDPASKKRRTEEVPYSPNPDVEEIRATEIGQGSSRPPGVKAAKAKGKKTTLDGKSCAEFEGMWVFREKEMAIKERLSKMALLESLVARKETLADYEEDLKKTLIQQLF